MNLKTTLKKDTFKLILDQRNHKGGRSYPVAGGELNAARVLLDNLFHLLPCCCQSDLKHKTLLTLITIIPDCQQGNMNQR